MWPRLAKPLADACRARARRKRAVDVAR